MADRAQGERDGRRKTAVRLAIQAECSQKNKCLVIVFISTGIGLKKLPTRTSNDRIAKGASQRVERVVGGGFESSESLGMLDGIV
jgi:hypothetical protein